MVTGGVILLLVGVTALLPWVVEAVVARLNPGGVAGQLAIRRLQLSSGTAARMVNGIAVAVAGAIALQMLFSGVEGDYTKDTGQDLTRAQMSVGVPQGVSLSDTAEQLTRTKGVRHLTVLSSGSLGDRRKDAQHTSELTVGDCAALREVARLPSCRDGDVFAVKHPDDTDTPKMIKSGRTVYLDYSYSGEPRGKEIAWKVPGNVRQADLRTDPTGYERWGVLTTPGALSAQARAAVSGQIFLRLDTSVPDVLEYVRNTSSHVDPLVEPMVWSSTKQSERFTSIRTGLFVGATAVLVLIGASLLVSQLEQLRERKKLLSALVAFGTRRRTLSLSVFWQTAIPIALGLALASAVGLTLGTVLLKMTSTPVRVDWWGVLAMTGIGAGIVLLVTAFSLPPLLRLMRPDGLRTE